MGTGLDHLFELPINETVTIILIIGHLGQKHFKVVLFSSGIRNSQYLSQELNLDASFILLHSTDSVTRVKAKFKLLHY